MATQPISDIHAQAEPEASWLPLIVVALAQILMVFNISSLQVSIEGIVSSFNTPATTIGTAIVTYSLVVAGLIMLGTRIGQIFGSFISNDQLLTNLASTSATPEHVSEAVRINIHARLVALKVSFFTLAGLALLAFFPAGGLPGYVRGEVPRGDAMFPGSVRKQSDRSERPQLAAMREFRAE